MAGLVDIGKLTRTVTVRGQVLTVTGIKSRIIHLLLDRFPEIRKLLSGAGVPLKPEDLISQTPDAVDLIIAHCMGDTSPEAIAAAADLTLGEQFDVLKTIWDITFPNGVEALAEALQALGLLIGPTWDQAMQSQGPSSSSLQAATPQK